MPWRLHNQNAHLKYLKYRRNKSLFKVQETKVKDKTYNPWDLLSLQVENLHYEAAVLLRVAAMAP